MLAIGIATQSICWDKRCAHIRGTRKKVNRGWTTVVQPSQTPGYPSGWKFAWPLSEVRIRIRIQILDCGNNHHVNLVLFFGGHAVLLRVVGEIAALFFQEPIQYPGKKRQQIDAAVV